MYGYFLLSFMVLALTIRSAVYSELLCVYGIKSGSSPIHSSCLRHNKAELCLVEDTILASLNGLGIPVEN